MMRRGEGQAGDAASREEWSARAAVQRTRQQPSSRPAEAKELLGTSTAITVTIFEQLAICTIEKIS
jgi:hypothetical protein